MANSAQLLILGNGFDLHCGLQSSYKDFFKYAIIDNQGEHFGIKQLKAGVSGFWEGLLFEYYKVNVDKDYKWCDIESIIQKTLWTIVFSENSPELNIQTCVWLDAIEIVNTEKWKESSNPIHNYILKYCCRFFSSSNKQQREKRKESLQLLLIFLLKELHNFEKRFCEYLRHNIFQDYRQGLNTQYLLNAVNFLLRLTNFTDTIYTDINQIVSRPENFAPILKKGYKLANEFVDLKNVHILSFNYTALFDILLVDAPCAYNNVHGKLCNRECCFCSASNIIFGIDDSIIQSQTENSELRLFSKTYRKMVDATTPTKILPANNIPVTIKFYGHSLSRADYSYFQSIFDYNNLYGNNNVDLVFYYSKGYEQTDAIYALINSYGKTLNNSDQGKNLMHKLLLENRLRIVEID